MKTLIYNTLLIAVAILAFGWNSHAQTMATNPVLWADVPDPDIIRVGDTYYMTSTTMHFNPGVPIMKSDDLVTWETVSYVYDRLADNDKANLENGSTMYGKGSWASCLRYANGYYYVYFLSYTTGKTHAYRTDDIENGTWDGYTINRAMHDLSVIFDDDGKVYSIYGGTDITLVELTADGLAIKAGGVEKKIITSAGSVAGTNWIVNGEGAHIQKINGMYYLFLISWPMGKSRTEIVYRSASLTSGWTGKVVLQSNGVAQGGIVETPNGDWYGMLFRDNGAVGRIPYLTKVTWTDNWPMMEAPATIDIEASSIGLKGIVSSDDFKYTSPSDLSPIWQWNHNPDDAHWSVTDRPGYFRITTSRTDADIYTAKNTLTQRTFGPTSTGIAAMDATNMKNGDYAGLSAFQDDYGFVGVKMSGGSKSIVMVNAGTEVESVPLSQNTVYLRSDCNFQNSDKATFYYSLDGTSWTAIGNTVSMSFKLTHFCGYRFALFNYATSATGGYVDFDYFKTGYNSNDLFPYTSTFSLVITTPKNNSSFVAPATIPVDVSYTEGATIDHIDFYLDDETSPFHEESASPYNFDWEDIPAGTYTLKAVAYDNEGNTAEDKITVKVNVPQAPYSGAPFAIPGTIELEHYDVGGNGYAYFDDSKGNTGGADFRTDEDVDIEDCSDTGKGYNLGWTTAGEWTEYTVDVASSGTYTLTLRAASNGSGKTLSLATDGNDIATDIEIPDTKGWQNWADVTVEDIALQAGEQVLKLTIGASAYINLNYMTFTAVSVAPTVTITAPLEDSKLNAGEEIAISADAQSTGGTIESVAFYAGDKLLDTDRTAPYEYNWSGMRAGNYRIVAIATDSNGEKGYDSISVRINPAPIMLKAGWTLVGCPIKGQTEISVALASVWDNVIAIKNYDEFYIKSHPESLNSLDSLEWGKGYFIKVNKNCELDWNIK